MSILHINQISSKIFGLFESYLDASDINPSDPQRKDKLLTRCLAAYGVYTSIECSAEDAAKAVVDGSDDNGIDALAYSSVTKKMVFVQAKFSKDGSGEPESAGVAKFCVGVKDLVNLNFERFNSKVNLLRPEIEKGLNDFDTKYSLLFVDTHTAPSLAIHSSRHIEDLLSEMNNIGTDQKETVMSFSRLNQEKIHSSLALSSGTSPIDIELGLTNWGLISEPYRAYYGLISGKEIASWWKNYDSRLFEKNIRQVLGPTDVNEEMERTIKESPGLFWYFNNGITIIAERIEKTVVGGGSRELGTFKLSKIAIVNGAQTVSTIGRFGLMSDNSSKLNELKVQVKMIQLSEAPENFDKDVTRANNRQNRIENRDFVSQDPNQIRLRTELLIDGIVYNIMRSEQFNLPGTSFDLIEATVALACASGKAILAVQAKSGIGKFFENLDRGIYKELFNPSVNGYFVNNSVKMVRLIEGLLQSRRSLLERQSGRMYGILIHGNRIIELLTFAKLFLKSQLSSAEFSYDVSQVDLVVGENVSKIDGFLEEKYKDNIMGTFFKNVSKCSELVTHILQPNISVREETAAN